MQNSKCKKQNVQHRFKFLLIINESSGTLCLKAISVMVISRHTHVLNNISR